MPANWPWRWPWNWPRGRRRNPHCRPIGRAHAAAAGLLSGKFPAAVSSLPWEGSFRVPEDIDVLIHALSLVPHDAKTHLPIDAASLRPELIVADLAVNPDEAWLLHKAAAGVQDDRRARRSGRTDGRRLPPLDFARSRSPLDARGGRRVPGTVTAFFETGPWRTVLPEYSSPVPIRE